VDGYARNHKIPIEWAEKKVRKEDYVLIGVKISLEFAAIGSDLRIDANFLDNVSTMAGGAGPPAA